MNFSQLLQMDNAAALRESAGFEIVFSAKTAGKETATVKAPVRDHSTGVDPEYGSVVTSRSVSITLPLIDLVGQGYPCFRNTKKPGCVTLNGDRVEYTDALGVANVMQVVECRPNRVTGSVTLLLGKAK